jgi:DNA-binding NarL/FixJ family response regulator
MAISPLRILVVADDPLARAGISLLLAEESTLEIIGQADPDTALDPLWDSHQPDVLLWDLGWEPSEASIGSLQDWANDDANLPLLLLLPDAEWVGVVWAMGVRGILRRDENAGILATALHATHHKLITLDPSFATVLSKPPAPPIPDLPEPLTPREIEVLQLLAEGLSNRAIAQKLTVSPHTIKFHVTALMGKLDAQSRTEVVVKATRFGLILL